MSLIVKKIENSKTYDFIMNKHYAKRKPSISYAFGLFEGETMVGCITYGKPASNPLCVGVCGKEYSKKVYELNRLILVKEVKNGASILISRSLKMLKNEDLIIVSYADEQMGHKGYVYQATNFIYTGLTKARTDKYVPEGRHPRHYTNEFENLRKYRFPKHRYIYFTGKSKRDMLNALNYQIMPYPKGDTKRYLLGERAKSLVINKLTGEQYFE